MSHQDLKVSVIIPNYNRANLIGETIENLLSQTLSPYEIIVVDDGSTDNSVDVIKSFGSRVNLICQSNKGPGPARNVGLSVATGDYVQFFDSDDLCSLNKLECQAKALEASGADIAYSPWVKVHIEKSKKINFKEPVLQQKQLLNSISPLDCFLRGWVSVFQALMFRHSFIKKVGTYRTDLMPSEDSEFLFRMLLQKPKMQFVPDCLVLYRSHSGGQITGGGTSNEYRAKDWNNFIKIVETQLIEHKPALAPMTHFKFEKMKWKSARYLEYLTQSTSINNSNNILSSLPMHRKIAYQVFDLFERLESRILTQITGTGYPYFYGTGWVRQHQLQLIREMGYTPIT